MGTRMVGNRSLRYDSNTHCHTYDLANVVLVCTKPHICQLMYFTMPVLPARMVGVLKRIVGVERSRHVGDHGIT